MRKTCGSYAFQHCPRGLLCMKSTVRDGYHCTPELPLPFMNIASQKNFVAVYHSGIYADKEILDRWSE